MRRFILFLCCFLISLLAIGQVDLRQYFEMNLRPQLNMAEFEHVKFKWDLEGKVQVFMNEGLNDLNDNNFSTALENFKKVTELAPEQYVGYYYRGVCNKLLHQYNDAEFNFRKALELKDTLSACYIAIGEIHQIKNDLKAAETNYEKAIKFSPRSVQAYYHRGNLEFIEGKMEEAEKEYQKCLKINPSFADAFVRLGLMALGKADRERAMGHFNDALKADSVSKEGLFWHGLLNISFNHPTEAQKDWNKLIQRNPFNPFFLIMRASLLIELKDFDQAFNDLKKALLANPEDTDKFVGGQTVLDKRIDLQTAARYLLRKIYGFNETDMNWIKHGFCLLLAGNFAQSINDFNRVDKEEGIIYYLKGLAFEQAGVHNSALELYNQAITKDPEIFDAYKKRGIYRMELRDYTGAIEDFTTMIKLDPRSIIGYRQRGITKALADKCQDAIVDLNAFINGDSTNREAFKTRAFCIEKRSEWAAAGSDYQRALELGTYDYPLAVKSIETLQKALDANPADNLSRFKLGKAFLAAGEPKKGIKEIKRCSESGFIPAQKLLAALKDKPLEKPLRIQLR